MQLSIIIAVYQRTDELNELLKSLCLQTDKAFEVIVVDDGSPTPLKDLVENFKDKLNIFYFYKSNSGPGKSRNYGMEKAHGDYYIFLDSDTIIPKLYIAEVKKELTENYVDAFGGPDAADESFNDLQKAITFSMTSFFTTGGIRGGKKHIGKFQPRSFNMGISQKAFLKTGGFKELRIGEDPDLSLTLWENGFDTRLFSDAKVFHKRRTSLKKFAKQVYEFGVARPILNQRHPKYVKPTFWLPSIFFLGIITAIFGLFLGIYLKNQLSYILFLPTFFVICYYGLIFISSTIQYKSLKIGLMSMLTTSIQFFCYGYGFLKSQFFLNGLKKEAKKIFPGHFYS